MNSASKSLRFLVPLFLIGIAWVQELIDQVWFGGNWNLLMGGGIHGGAFLPLLSVTADLVICSQTHFFFSLWVGSSFPKDYVITSLSGHVFCLSKYSKCSFGQLQHMGFQEWYLAYLDTCWLLACSKNVFLQLPSPWFVLDCMAISFHLCCHGMCPKGLAG